MCVAVPGKVVAIGPEGATVRVGQRTRRASTLLFPDLRAGEYVLVSSGTVVDRLSTDEAEQRLTIFDTLMEALDETT
ncbi:MAG: HypC/HybG/HupF family hydrogenase formation chaperone [Dehalococcoidia bacterium]